MSKDKLTDYSATAGSNTDIGGINIDEGMLPSNVNNALREQMSHLADFAAGTTGINVLNLQDDDASASIKIQAPATVTTTTTFTLPDGDGTANQVLTTNGSGVLSWGNAVLSFNVFEYTATASQTTFSGADDNAATLAYTAGSIMVFLNGVQLDPSDYTATNGTSIVLTSGAALNDELNIFAFGAFNVADTVAASTGGTFNGGITATSFTGDGSNLTGIQAGAGYFQGENGATGDTTNGKGDIFRVHEQQLDTNTTIAAGDNAGAFFSLTVASGVTLTINGNLVIA